jgi:hypothetical protein
MSVRVAIIAAVITVVLFFVGFYVYGGFVIRQHDQQVRDQNTSVCVTDFETGEVSCT